MYPRFEHGYYLPTKINSHPKTRPPLRALFEADIALFLGKHTIQRNPARPLQDAPVENGKESDTSGRQRMYENKRRDGDRRGVSTTTSHTASMSAVQPIPVVRTQTAAAAIPLDMDELLHLSSGLVREVVRLQRRGYP